jgi:FkbM family methyltransferase
MPNNIATSSKAAAPTLTIKALKLCAAALLGTAACLIFLYATQPVELYAIYRCLTGAESPLACVQGKPTAFRTTTFGIVYEGNTEDMIDRHVLGYGAYEKPELFFLRDVSKGGVFLDIGANKGLYSLFMSRYQKEIHAFEPYEPVLKQFRTSVANNGIQNIIIHPVGLGDKHEFLTFEKPGATNMGTGTFAFLSADGPHEQLEIITGDEALRKAGVTEVELIKMDIEGFEQPALKGLKSTLTHSRPIVVFELTINKAKPVLFKSLEEISRAFPSGYKFLVFKNRDLYNLYTGAYELGPISGALNFDSNFEQHDVIAFPSEKRGRIPLKGPVN